MSRRPSAIISPEQAGRNASAAIARARLLDIEVERPKRIDQYIDYFGIGGKGGRASAAPGRSERQGGLGGPC